MIFFLAGAYSINYNTDMLQKNLHADLTNPNVNPNVYHSIDDNFEDHVYDEIKAKDNPGKENCRQIKQKKTVISNF